MIAKVVAIESSSAFTDGIPRATLRFTDADKFYKELRLRTDLFPNPSEVELDQEYNIVLQKVIEVKT